jgi:hypothetical protein
MSDEPKPDDPAPETEAAAKAERKKRKKAKAAAAKVASTEPRAIEIATAFEAGNFARVRELAVVLAGSDDEALAAVGRDYLARIGVDRIQMVFLLACAVALGTIAWIYIGR